MAGKSKILIIGGTGYIGKFIVEASAKSGHPTFALARESTISDPVKGKIIEGFKNSGVTILIGDLYDHESLVKAIKQVDVVISTVGHLQLADQTKIIAAIKEAGNVKRFFPSEFGNDVDRTRAVEPAKSAFATKAQIRRAIEAEGIPYTYVSSNYFAGYSLPTLAQPGATAPPRDKVIILGDGNAKDCSTRYELSEAEWAIIEDIYRRSPRLRSFSHLIERSRYFIDFGLMAPKDKFTKKDYALPDMASIMKATSTAGAKALKPGSTGAKQVKSKLDRLSKNKNEKEAEEEVQEEAPKGGKPAVAKGKGVADEPQKKRKLGPGGGSSSFGTTVSFEKGGSKQPKLLQSSIDAAMVAQSRKIVMDDVARAEGATKKKVVERTPGKSGNFLGGREDKIAPAVIEMLPPEVRAATEGFNKFWTERWQNYVATCDAVDLTTTLVSQTARALGVALECQTVLADIQSRNRASRDELEKVKAELAEKKEANIELRIQRDVDDSKRDALLAEIEALKKEVHESQCEVAALTKKVEISDNHQKVTAEALEKANLELTGARDAGQFMEKELRWLEAEVKRYEADVVEAGDIAVRNYIANFHHTEEYRRFGLYWSRVAYQEVFERLGEVHPELDVSELRAEFLEEEVPQTPAEEGEVVELDPEDEPTEGPQPIEAPQATDAPAPPPPAP